MTQEEHLDYSHNPNNPVYDQVHDGTSEPKNITNSNEGIGMQGENSVQPEIGSNKSSDSVLKVKYKVPESKSEKRLEIGNTIGNRSDTTKEMTVITQQNNSDSLRDIQTNIEKINKENLSENAGKIVNLSDRATGNINFHSEKAISNDLQSATSGKFPKNENSPEIRDKREVSVDENDLKQVSPEGDGKKLKKSQENDDPIARLNALRANITNALKEVKAVLEKHAPSIDEPDKNDDIKPEEESCIKFRFVRRVRKKSQIQLEDQEIICNISEKQEESIPAAAPDTSADALSTVIKVENQKSFNEIKEKSQQDSIPVQQQNIKTAEEPKIISASVKKSESSKAQTPKPVQEKTKSDKIIRKRPKLQRTISFDHELEGQEVKLVETVRAKRRSLIETNEIDKTQAVQASVKGLKTGKSIKSSTEPDNKKLKNTETKKSKLANLVENELTKVPPPVEKKIKKQKSAETPKSTGKKSTAGSKKSGEINKKNSLAAESKPSEKSTTLQNKDLIDAQVVTKDPAQVQKSKELPPELENKVDKTNIKKIEEASKKNSLAPESKPSEKSTILQNKEFRETPAKVQKPKELPPKSDIKKTEEVNKKNSLVAEPKPKDKPTILQNKELIKPQEVTKIDSAQIQKPEEVTCKVQNKDNKSIIKNSEEVYKSSSLILESRPNDKPTILQNKEVIEVPPVAKLDNAQKQLQKPQEVPQKVGNKEKKSDINKPEEVSKKNSLAPDSKSNEKSTILQNKEFREAPVQVQKPKELPPKTDIKKTSLAIEPRLNDKPTILEIKPLNETTAVTKIDTTQDQKPKDLPRKSDIKNTEEINKKNSSVPVSTPNDKSTILANKELIVIPALPKLDSAQAQKPEQLPPKVEHVVNKTDEVNKDNVQNITVSSVEASDVKPNEKANTSDSSLLAQVHSILNKPKVDVGTQKEQAQPTITNIIPNAIMQKSEIPNENLSSKPPVEMSPAITKETSPQKTISKIKPTQDNEEKKPLRLRLKRHSWTLDLRSKFENSNDATSLNSEIPIQKSFSSSEIGPQSVAPITKKNITMFPVRRDSLTPTLPISATPSTKLVSISNITENKLENTTQDKHSENSEKSLVGDDVVPPEILSSEPTKTTEGCSALQEANTNEDSSGKVNAISKKRKMKKKVIIRRIKRRLSKDDSIDAKQEPEICERELEDVVAKHLEEERAAAEKAAAEAEAEALKELAPPKRRSCLKLRSYEPGDKVIYADHVRKSVKWKDAIVVEKITNISYKLMIEGVERPAHISYIKKHTDKKVQFGGMEVLEIDYEQENEESEDDEPVYNIWARV